MGIYSIGDVRYMNRKIYWLVLLNPLFLILYGYGLSELAKFCRFGGIARRLPVIIGIFIAGVLWFVAWTIIYFIRKQKSISDTKQARWMLPVLIGECLVILILTGYNGYEIYQSAQPYNGKLWSYIHEQQTTERIALEDSELNFLETGLDGVITELSEQCGLNLDWELHTANTMKVVVDNEGMIQSLDAFIYAFDDSGDYHAWLVTYDSTASSRMTVYLDNITNTDYPDQESLSPLFDMIDALLEDDSLLEELGFEIEESETEKSETGTEESETVTFTLYYSGYEDGNYQTSAADSWYELIAGDSDDSAGTLQLYQPALYSGHGEGFLLTLYSGEIKLLTVIAEADTLEPIAEIEARESEVAEIEDAKTTGNTLVSDDNGMTFYLNESISMSLIVIDAAAGSRAYAFENGEIYNEDPFNGSSGVAESIYFLDEKVGFILLTSASQDHSRMYYTTDGGESFEQVLLPTEDGANDISGNELELTAEDMDYIYTPYEEDGVLYVEVSYDSGGRGYMVFLFKSEDDGASWQYVSCENNL